MVISSPDASLRAASPGGGGRLGTALRLSFAFPLRSPSLWIRITPLNRRLELSEQCAQPLAVGRGEPAHHVLHPALMFHCHRVECTFAHGSETNELRPPVPGNRAPLDETLRDQCGRNAGDVAAGHH